MSKFFEALTVFQHVVNSYAEDDAITEIVLDPKSFNKIKWVIIRELEMGGNIVDGQAFGFEHLVSDKAYFKCRGIKFVRRIQ